MSNQAPKGATHRYEHGGLISWYREVDGKLFVWRDGSWWYRTAFKSAEELVKSCMLSRVTPLVMEQAEPAGKSIDDLDWLARSFDVKNIHNWMRRTFSLDGVCAEFADHDDDERLKTGNWYQAKTILARRAELQNKPSWKDAPEWANWLAKDSADREGSAAWWWYADKPVAMNNTWQVSTDGRAMLAAGCECEIGSWRDTLEQRPVSATESPVDAAIKDIAGSDITSMPIAEWVDSMRLSGIEKKAQEAADLALRVSTMLREDPGLFSANEIADLHQLCDAELTKRDAAVCGGQKYLDANWFERGELPPVGVECEALAEDITPEGCKIIAYHKDTVAVKWFKYNGGCLDVLGMPGWSFRPIRTERDELTTLLTQAGITTCVDQAADAILAAGFKRDGGGV